MGNPVKTIRYDHRRRKLQSLGVFGVELPTDVVSDRDFMKRCLALL